MAAQLLGFTSNHLSCHGNKLIDNVRRTSGTVSPPAAGILSTFVGSFKVRRHSLSSWSSSSRSYTRQFCKSQLVQDFASTASAGYAVLLLGGGLFGYIKSGRKRSLLGGLTGTTLIMSAYCLMQVSETKEIGYAIAFGASLLFAFIFGIRFAATRKLLPSGLLLCFSLGLMVVIFSAYVQGRI